MILQVVMVFVAPPVFATLMFMALSAAWESGYGNLRRRLVYTPLCYGLAFLFGLLALMSLTFGLTMYPVKPDAHAAPVAYTLGDAARGGRE